MCVKPFVCVLFDGVVLFLQAILGCFWAHKNRYKVFTLFRRSAEKKIERMFRSIFTLSFTRTNMYDSRRRKKKKREAIYQPEAWDVWLRDRLMSKRCLSVFLSGLKTEWNDRALLTSICLKGGSRWLEGRFGLLNLGFWKRFCYFEYKTGTRLVTADFYMKNKQISMIWSFV